MKFNIHILCAIEVNLSFKLPQRHRNKKCFLPLTLSWRLRLAQTPAVKTQNYLTPAQCPPTSFFKCPILRLSGSPILPLSPQLSVVFLSLLSLFRLTCFVSTHSTAAFVGRKIQEQLILRTASLRQSIRDLMREGF